MRTRLLPALALAAVTLVGCGPMGSGPMPPRLEPDEQKKIDDAWDQALTPVDHLDRQATLDTLIVSQAFQAGVDRLEFRSEKKFSGGVVVMEIHFDRARPNDDRFEVSVRDPAGKELRRLVYTRAEVEAAYRDLNDSRYTQPQGPNLPPNQPVDARKREEVQKRRAVVEQLFQKAEDAKPKG
jgi:hypothetical protein